MRGHVRKRGKSWVHVMELGEQWAMQCPECPRATLHWADSLSIPEQCPTCGSELQRVLRRRQHWSPGLRTRTEAEAALAAALVERNQGRFVPTTDLTLGSYLLDVWLPAKKPGPKEGGARKSRGRVGIQTWEGYTTYCERYIVPHIGTVRLAELAPRHLDRLYTTLEEQGGRRGQGLAPKTLVNIHGILTKSLGDAVKRGLLVSNPAKRVERPTASKPTTQVWSVEELRAFLRHVEEDRLYAAWLLFATTGMRRGEVAGLAWEDIDLDAGLLTVRWSLGVVANQPTWKAGAKTEAGDRRISLDPATVAALRRYRLRQNEERLLAGPAWEVDNVDERGNGRRDVVFTWADGRMIHPERWYRWLQEHSDQLGLPKIRLHDLRHTYATAALQGASGWHEVKVISKRLGHASVGITIDTYGHVLPADDEAIAHSLARHILDGS